MIFKDKKKINLLIIVALVIIVPFISIGYSALSTILNIRSDVTSHHVVLRTKDFPDEIEYLMDNDSCMARYEGEVTDEVNNTVSAKNVYFNKCSDKRNIIFNNICWQMIRTTETGGIKMIYNGVAENNQCLNTRGTNEGFVSGNSQILTSNYWYGTDYIYDKVNQNFKLGGTTEQVIWNETTGPGLIGKYTCKSTNVNDTCSTLYLITSYINTSSAYTISLNSNSHYSQFGNLQFNTISGSPAYAGYMYGDVYYYGSIDMVEGDEHKITQTVGSSMMIGDSIVDNGNGMYTINNAASVSLADWQSNYSNYEYKYTCNDNSTTCENPRYIASTTSSKYSYYNAGEKIMIGKGRNGVTLTDTIQVRIDELLRNSSDYSDYKYTCHINSISCTEENLRMIVGVVADGYYYEPNHYFGSSVTWDGTKYTLVDPIGIENYDNVNNISTHHYMCLGVGLKSCQNVVYVYNIFASTSYYITLKDGVTTGAQTLQYMLNNNTTNSIIKIGVEAWYKHNMLNYDQFIEDTVFCNDRSIISLGGWSDNGVMGNYTFYENDLQFKGYNLSNDLSCTNVTDRFSVSNTNAPLNYKVGLISSSEMNNINDVTLRQSGSYYWTLSPRLFDLNYVRVNHINSSGSISNYDAQNTRGVRPVISLKSGVEIASGTGSETDPWVIDESEKLHDKIVNLSSTDYLITKYNGDVTDSVGSTTTATKVYFDKHFKVRNVIFGGFCWQIIRTTETGGTKMIYNGEPVDGKCESTRSNHKGVVQTSYYEQTLDSSYLYGSSFTYDTTNNVFALVDTTTATWGSSTYENLIGKFTCKSASNTCSTMYLLNGYKSNTQAYAAAYTVSDTNYAQIGTSSYNANYGSPASVGYMFNKVYNHNEKSIGTNTYKFGNSFTYDSGTNTYTLAGTTQTISDWTTGYNTINNTHYTCWNTTGSCTTISYIDYTTKTKANYFDMSDGKSANDILEEMLVSNDVNRYNSNIKGIVDSWYAQNLLTKTSMLEDIVFCNARNITDYGPWNPDGGNTVSGNMIKFKNYSRTNNLACANLTDQFAVGNNKAKLTYPVGLLQDEERNNPNFVSLWKTGTSWWELSPFQFKDPYAFERLVNTEGRYDDYDVYYGYGVRPVISLKNSVLIASGSGDLTDPWIIQE